jgi:Mg2+-importing ATPase
MEALLAGVKPNDLVTFGAMLWLFHADAVLFRTGWFIESLATQTLVVFVIRTRRRPWRSRPSGGLIAGICAVLVVAVALPFSPVAPVLGFTPPPPAFFAFLIAVVVTYLAMVELLKSRLARPAKSGAARG